MTPWWLAAALSLPGPVPEPEPWRTLAPFHNVAWLQEVTAPHAWYRDGACLVGVPVDGPEDNTRLRCEAELAGASRKTRHLPGHRGRLVYEGTWREVTVHELVPFPETAGTSQRLVSGGELVYALDDQGALRLLTTHAGGYGLMCAGLDDCVPGEALWLDWRAPAEIEGTSVAFATALKEGGDPYAEARHTLEEAALVMIGKVDRGERPITAPSRPPGPPAPQALRWEIQLYRRDASGQSTDAQWRIEVPLDLPMSAFATDFPALGLHLTAQAYLDTRELRVQVTTADGEASSVWPFSLQLGVTQGVTVARSEPGVAPDRVDAHLTVAGPDGGTVDVFPLLHLHRSPIAAPFVNTGRAGPVIDPQAPATPAPTPQEPPAPAAPAPPATVEVPLLIPRDLRLVPVGPAPRAPGATHPMELLVRAESIGETDVIEVAVPCCVPVVQRAELYLGQSFPDLNAAPTATAAGARFPYTLAAPDVMLRLTGAWVVVRWTQGDTTVYAHGYRLPSRAP